MFRIRSLFRGLLVIFPLLLAACAGELGGLQPPRPEQDLQDLSTPPLKVDRGVTPPKKDSAAPPKLDQSPPPSRLTVKQIVGGSYSVLQPYGKQLISYDYSYCQAYGAPVGYHCAVDIGLTRGTPLFAGAAGEVLEAGGTGYFTDQLNAKAGELHFKLTDGTEVIYGHSSAIEVTIGEKIKAGQRVALSGTGNNSPHLHLEVRVPDASLASRMRTVDPVVFFGP